MRLRVPRLSVLAAVLGFVVAPSVAAQTRRLIEPLPRTLAEAFDLRGGTVQRLALPLRRTRGWKAFQFDVVLDGDRVTVYAEPHNLRSDDFRVVGSSAPFAPTSYRGGIVGLPGATAALNLYEGQLKGVLLIGDDIWGIQPASEALAWLPRDAHVVYRRQQIEAASLGCSVIDPFGGPTETSAPTTEKKVSRNTLGAPRPAPSSAPRNAPYVAELAIELDPSYQKDWGGTESAIRQATAVINACDAVYRRDANVTLRLTGIVIRDGKGYPFLNGSAVLGAFRDAWKDHPVTLKRDVAHLFTSYNGGTLAGLAFLGTVCQPSFHYSVSWDYSLSLVTATTVTAHEIGHVFGAAHCSNSQCYIMCAYIGACAGTANKFGSTSAGIIRRGAKNGACINN